MGGNERLGNKINTYSKKRRKSHAAKQNGSRKSQVGSVVSRLEHGELDGDDAAALADAIAAGDGGDPTDTPRGPATALGRIRPGGKGVDDERGVDHERRAPPLDLDLGDNPSLGCEGARSVAALVAEGSIGTLSLENCGVGELGATAIAEALASPGCVLR